jgi:hypothetical protein
MLLLSGGDSVWQTLDLPTDRVGACPRAANREVCMVQLRSVRRGIAILAVLLIPMGAVPGTTPSGAATRHAATTTGAASATVRVTITVDTFVARRYPGNVFTGYAQYDIPLQNFVVNAGYSQQPITVADVAGTFRGLQKFDFSQFAGRQIVKAVWHGYAYAVTGTKPVVLALRPISTP